ncbi:Hypothetical protein ETEE_3384 [Edwardsiella anguillarum ET080813]|uniref:Uncharacterized protein n=1 Tax=Edwardsiella anguillarum ET080813 TaxID=667120 RepID=A0A076LPI2_9GAMM|nr:Hypothetical protein ETEE_3384 [Edwardsiella anguillarum ET080813]
MIEIFNPRAQVAIKMLSMEIYYTFSISTCKTLSMSFQHGWLLYQLY